jgi:hypothetical protein
VNIRPILSRNTLVKLIVSMNVLAVITVAAQPNSTERSFPQTKSTIEKVLKSLQADLAGRLPVLEGFAKLTNHPFDRYQRGYYQSNVEVQSTASGGSLVRVTTKVTAWYTGPGGSRSGYKLLSSNGRIETDLLDQLEEQLAKDSSANSKETAALSLPTAVLSSVSTSSSPTSASTSPAKSADEPTKATESVTDSAPIDPRLASPLRPSLPERKPPETPVEHTSGKRAGSLEAEVNNLQEVLKNTAHPQNLVAVKKSGTPVLATPSLMAKPQFLASMHDEFELLDFNADWVHVRFSGLSRGWIWRNSVEMPAGINDTDVPTMPEVAPIADLFHVVREDSAAFPGDWEPLRNKNVKILSVQKIQEKGKSAGPKERLEYAKFLLEKSYTEISERPSELAGVVVIFDAADGGMIATTTAALRQWVRGNLSDSALWRNCLFDPPETFDSSHSSGSN